MAAAPHETFYVKTPENRGGLLDRLGKRLGELREWGKSSVGTDLPRNGQVLKNPKKI
jgi:hypothetical protein